MSLIAYVGPWSFPEGGAGARRILGNALSIRAAGHEVRLGCGELSAQGADKEREFEGFCITAIGERTAEHLPSALKRLLYFGMGRKTQAWLDSLQPRPQAVILYSGYSPYLLRLLPWCRRHGIPLIFDAVEWYDPPAGLAGLVSPYYWNIELAMRYLIPRAGNVIGISSYLETYYRQRGCNTERVPPTLDTQALDARLEFTGDRPISLAYAGNPGNKDLLDNYLEAIIWMDGEGQHFRLSVAGLSPAEVLAYPALRSRGIVSLPSWLTAYGSLSHAQALEVVREADFSLLLREPKRFTQAGFPTKFVESLAVGTPVIANITSDLDRYLRDGEQGMVCADHEVGSMVEALSRVLSLSDATMTDMRRAARRMAEDSFDYRLYTGHMQRLLENAIY